MNRPPPAHGVFDIATQRMFPIPQASVQLRFELPSLVSYGRYGSAGRDFTGYPGYDYCFPTKWENDEG